MITITPSVRRVVITPTDAPTITLGASTRTLTIDTGRRGRQGIPGTPAVYSDATPAALGVAAAGAEDAASRRDHVHPMPTLDDLGAAAQEDLLEVAGAVDDVVADLAAASGAAAAAQDDATAALEAIGTYSFPGPINAFTLWTLAKWANDFNQAIVDLAQLAAASHLRSKLLDAASIDTSPTTGGVVQYDGTKYVNGLASASSIADAAITMAKHADMAASTVIGRAAGTTGVPSALALVHSLIADGTGVRLSGDVASPGGPSEYGTDDAGTRGWYPTGALDSMRSMPSRGTRRTIVIATDFLGYTATGAHQGWLSDSSSGAFSGPASDVLGRTGIARASTSTSSAGAAGFRAGLGDWAFGIGRMSFRVELRLNALSDGTETFTARVGFCEGFINTAPVDGGYLVYTHSVNSGRWQCVTVSNSSENATDSGVTADATSYHCYEVEVNAAATSVRFWIDGVLVGTHTTLANIPSGLARATEPSTRIIKSAGTTARTMDHDYLAARIDLTTPL